MKILVVSDTHRKDDNLKLVLSEECPLDMLIHLGDAEGSEHFIPDWVNPECRMEMVLGHKAFITHGHYYGVSMGPEGLVDEAKSRGCDIAMYGHTHRPFLDVIDGVTVLNPGSLSYPRQEGRRPSYMIIHVDADGKMDYQQKYL